MAVKVIKNERECSACFSKLTFLSKDVHYSGKYYFNDKKNTINYTTEAYIVCPMCKHKVFLKLNDFLARGSVEGVTLSYNKKTKGNSYIDVNFSDGGNIKIEDIPSNKDGLRVYTFSNNLNDDAVNGFIDKFKDALNDLLVNKYPSNNDTE